MSNHEQEELAMDSMSNHEQEELAEQARLIQFYLYISSGH